MPDASRFVASQYLLDGRIVPGGIATPEGFDGSGPYSFGAGMSARGLRFLPGGEGQEHAGAVCAVGNREGCGPFCKETHYGELFGRDVYRKGGWSAWETASVLAHQGSLAGGDRVVGPLLLGEFLAK